MSLDDCSYEIKQFGPKHVPRTRSLEGSQKGLGEFQMGLEGSYIELRWSMLG